MSVILARLKERRVCGDDSCEGPALPLSEPPRCAVHIGDPDGWFEDLEGQVSSSDVPEMVRDLTLAMAHDLYRTSLLHDPIRGQLYSDYKRRVDPREEVSFSFFDAVYFAIAAAAAGIIGNLTYDTVKGIIRKIARRSKDDTLEVYYEETVQATVYEELRISKHAKAPASSEADEPIRIEIERKFRLVVRDRHPKGR